jgi:hypothetical protein
MAPVTGEQHDQACRPLADNLPEPDSLLPEPVRTVQLTGGGACRAWVASSRRACPAGPAGSAWSTSAARCYRPLKEVMTDRPASWRKLAAYGPIEAGAVDGGELAGDVRAERRTGAEPPRPRCRGLMPRRTGHGDHVVPEMDLPGAGAIADRAGLQLQRVDLAHCGRRRPVCAGRRCRTRHASALRGRATVHGPGHPCGEEPGPLRIARGGHGGCCH